MIALRPTICCIAAAVGLCLASASATAETDRRAATLLEELPDDPALDEVRGAVLDLGSTVLGSAERIEFEIRASFSRRAFANILKATRIAFSLGRGDAVLAAMSARPLPRLTERPVMASLSSPFGVRRDPINRRRKHHNGLDFAADRHAPVHAAGPGLVVRASRSRGYGRVVYIDHGHGVQTRYAHLQRIEVKPGEFVPRGARLGTVGSSGRATGPHLHFEVRVDGEPVRPAAAVDFALVAPEREEDSTRARPRRRPKKQKKSRQKPRREFVSRRHRPNV